MNFDIIKAKLLRGGNTSPGEIKLITAELVKLVEGMEAGINEQEIRINALSARSSGGARKNSKTTEVRSDEDK